SENGVTELLAAAKAFEKNDKDPEAKWFDGVIWDRPLSDANKQKAEAFFTKHKDVLDTLTAASGKKIDWGYEFTSPVFAMLLPTLSGQRHLANVLFAEAMHAHQNGDDREAMKWVSLLLSQTRAMTRQPFIVSHLVTLGI